MTRSTFPGVMLLACVLWSNGCKAPSTKPVDIYPEDMCAFCRMAFSDQRFAAEIILENGEVHKFDDIGCLEEFTRSSTALKIAATYYKDFDTKEWIPSSAAIVLRTDLSSPMGSGVVAFSDSTKAKEFLRTRHL